MKKMRFLRVAALAVALLMLLPALLACNEKTPETTTTTTETPTTTTTTGTTPDETPELTRLCLVENGVARYSVVTPVSSQTSLTTLVQAFVDDFRTETGVTMKKITDSYMPESEGEIVIGASRNREDVLAISQETPYTGYQAATSGERIVFWAFSDKHYEKMLGMLIEDMYEENGSWYVDIDAVNYAQDTLQSIEAPNYATKNGRLQGAGAYISQQGTVAVTYENTSREEYEAYLATLVASGYTKYTDNQIGNVEFVTYTKDNYTVHLQFINTATKKQVTINYFKDQFLPSVERPQYTAVTRASANYLERFGYDGWGLSMIVQLSDGTYIICDGGKSDQRDRANMIKFMQDNKPASHEKPIVSLWLLSHPHEDHVEMFAYDARLFAQSVEVRMLGYNFPVEACTQVDAEGRYFNEYYHNAIEKKRLEYFPNSTLWTAHTGQKLYLADAEIDVLYTHEDYYPQAIYSANDCNTNFRITIDGVTLMVLGDSDLRGNTEMTAMYGDALRAEMVQASHHGANGPAEMYMAMDPKVVFWPDCYEDIMVGDSETAPRIEHPYNRPWAKNQWEWGNEKGDRVHHTASETSRVYFDSFK